MRAGSGRALRRNTCAATAPETCAKQQALPPAAGLGCPGASRTPMTWNRCMIVRSLLSAAGAIILLGAPTGAEEAKQSRMETYELLNLFGDVFERVRADYVEETTDEELIEAAVNGMLSALDPHSSYLDQKKYEDMKVQTQGSFGGLG